jgi:hypothetical protein
MTALHCTVDTFEVAADAIIFDLDGVLVNSRPIVERHWENWRKCDNILNPIPQELMHGCRTRDAMAIMRPECDNTDAAREFDDREGRDTDGLEAITGARELLARLPSDRWAIVASSDSSTLPRHLDHCGRCVPWEAGSRRIHQGREIAEGFARELSCSGRLIRGSHGGKRGSHESGCIGHDP